jgi:capsular exopolysaccharide synthesis family protein
MQFADTVSDDSTRTQLRDFFAVLARGRWIIVISIAALVLTMLLVTLLTRPTYEATARVLVHQKSEERANPFATVADGRDEKLANELGILRTRALARRVAESLLQYQYLDTAHKVILPVILLKSSDRKSTDLADVAVISGRVQSAMLFAPERESDIIKITAASGDPKEAAILANAYAESYRVHVMDQSRSMSRSVREFLEGRLREQREQLSRAEGSVRDYMQESGMVNLTGESDRVVNELGTLEAKRNALSIDIKSLDKKIASIEAELPQRGGTIASTVGQANDSYIKLLQDQLAQLEVQRDVMIAQNDPAVLAQEMNRKRLKNLEDQISSLRLKLQARTSEVIQGFMSGSPTSSQSDPVGNLRSLSQQLLEARIQLEGLRSQENTLNGIIAEYERKFRALPKQSIDLARLQRERVSAEKLYTMVEEKYNESAISEKSEFGNVSIIDEAEPPSDPVSPDLMKNLIIGLFLGIGCGIGVVVTKNMVDASIHSPEQLKRRGYDSLAEIGTMDQELKEIPKDWALPEDVQKFDKALWLIFNPMSFVAESYRRLRSGLLRLNLESPMKVLVISSPNPSEGKSTTISNLALSLAETQRRILLIDADLRQPSVQRLFSLDLQPGLADVLTSHVAFQDVVRKEVVPHLDVLTAGNPLEAPSRVFGGAEMTEFLKKVRAQYDWVLIDAPPILVVNDGAVLAAISDGVILTVTAGSTRFDALERATGFLTSVGGRILGLVVNKFDPKTAYGGYYGSYKYGNYDKRRSQQNQPQN